MGHYAIIPYGFFYCKSLVVDAQIFSPHSRCILQAPKITALPRSTLYMFYNYFSKFFIFRYRLGIGFHFMETYLFYQKLFTINDLKNTGKQKFLAAAIFVHFFSQWLKFFLRSLTST